jgi:S1-C subfamily serine protease
MRKAVFALFVVLLASFAAAMSPVEIKRDYGEAVVTITTYSAAEDAVGLGSGFIVDPSGVIVTCYHVINGAYPAVVKLLNGASFQDISVLGCDSTKDVAVIRVKGRNLPTVKLASAGGDEVGERVVAIGNPRGLENTISDGLLSGVREMDGYELLQISAPISPGSSGGPVFNSSGMVVGIASAFLTESQNLNFCVPIRYASPFVTCISGVSLEDFSHGVRPGEAEVSQGLSAGSRRHFLSTLIPILSSFWEVAEWQRFDKYRRHTDDPGMVIALVREESDRVSSELQALRAPDTALQRILQRYVDLAKRQNEAVNIALGSLSTMNSVAASTAAAKMELFREEIGTDECLNVLSRDLACQYMLDAGVKVYDLDVRLPSIADSLPSILVMGLETAVREQEPSSARAASLAAAVHRGLGFRQFWSEPGIIVDTVYEGKQARRAGLLRGDIIVGANDAVRLANMWDYDMFRANQPTGVPFKLNILRNGHELGLTAKFDSQ